MELIEMGAYTMEEAVNKLAVGGSQREENGNSQTCY